MSQKNRDPYHGDYDSSRSNYPRRPCTGVFVGVLRRTMADRGLQLIPQHSRCIRSTEIHEFILTEEQDAAPGREANRIAYLGFAEFSAGGVILVGDRFVVRNEEIGRIAGYDETHMPNHMNILVRGTGLKSGYDRGIAIGDRFTIVSPYSDER